MHLPQFNLEKWFDRYEFSAKYLLGSSDVKPLLLGELMKIIHLDFRKMRNLSLGYTFDRGEPSLRKEIAKIYNSTDIEEILITNGASEGIMISMNCLVNKGDTVVVVFPSYQPLYQIAATIGAKIVKWEYTTENKFRLSVEDLPRISKKPPKLIIINNPHNPTGSMFTQAELIQIYHYALDNDAILICDEVFSGISLKRRVEYKSIQNIAKSKKNLVVINSSSKIWGLAGLRTGWIVADKKIIEKCVGFKYYTSLCNPKLDQYIFCEVLKHKEKFLERSQSIVSNNYICFSDWHKSYKKIFDWIQPAAGLTTFLRFRKNVSSNYFCQKLLHMAGVLLVPGKFCFQKEGYIRIGYGLDNEKFSKGLTLLGKFLKMERYNE